MRDSHSLVMSMMRKLSYVSLMACKGIFRLGYIPKSLQICSWPCKWPNRSVLLLPLLAKMTSIHQNKPSLCRLLLGNTREMVACQWSLVSLQCLAASVIPAANTVTKLHSASTMQQLPTLCPTKTMVPRASRMPNLVICSVLLGNCSLSLLI